jgi:hypothetical protein
MSRKIPDLRVTPEITLEHCSVLMKRIETAIDLIDGSDIGPAFVDDLDITILLQHYEEQFEPQAFFRMFSTEAGKNILVGTYVQRLLDMMEDEDAEEYL